MCGTGEKVVERQDVGCLIVGRTGDMAQAFDLPGGQVFARVHGRHPGLSRRRGLAHQKRHVDRKRIGQQVEQVRRERAGAGHLDEPLVIAEGPLDLALFVQDKHRRAEVAQDVRHLGHDQRRDTVLTRQGQPRPLHRLFPHRVGQQDGTFGFVHPFLARVLKETAGPAHGSEGRTMSRAHFGRTEERHAAGTKGAGEPVQQQFLGLLVVVDQRVAADDQVTLREGLILDHVMAREHHLPPQQRVDLEGAALCDQEFGAQVARRDLGQRRVRIDAALGLFRRGGLEVGRIDAEIAFQAVAHPEVVTGKGEAVGLLTGRTGRAPGLHLAPGAGTVAEKLRQDDLLQRLPCIGVAEETGDATRNSFWSMATSSQLREM